MNKLEELRAKLRQQDNRNGGNGDSSTYRFWDMDYDARATIRFLPDANEDNTFFWVEKQMINLTFPGVAGHDENKDVVVKVPCMEMYGETCPVLTEIRPWFNEPSLEETARKYWKKRNYIFSGFVITDPTNESEPPENPIRRFTIGPGLFKIIKAALLDLEMESLPTDYDNGSNFTITKTRNGKYADYGTSNYARRESPLSPEQRDAIDEHGLVDLGSLLPKKPTPEAVAAITEMFEASVNGELYDPSRWSSFYRPYGMDFKDGSGDNAKASVKASEKAEPQQPSGTTTPDDEVPFDVNEDEAKDSTVAKSGAKTADDIINMIRNR